MTIIKCVVAFSKTFGGSVLLAAVIVAGVLAGPSKAVVADGTVASPGANFVSAR
jgi:hypothetical protein